MKFNNGYLPFFFFCWALLYSPLAVWYAFEQSKNLNPVNAKVGHNVKRRGVGVVDCFPCTYVSLSYAVGYNSDRCSFGDTTTSFFVFYKLNQLKAYGPK